MNTDKSYVQFSKKLTIAVFIIWGILRIASLILVAFNSENATAITALQKGADDICICAIGFYNGNSVAEKGIQSYFNSKVTSDDDDDAEG